jgi:H+/Cl- antiporter ClcA
LLTAIEWDFLHKLGWSAGLFDNPDTPWPSSTALGDYGFLQVLDFLLLGVSVLALAVALFRLLEVRRKVGPSLLVLLAAGLAGSAVRTDYATARGSGPDTWNGVTHAAALTVVLPAALASMFVLAAQFRRDERWRPWSRYSLLAGTVALACLVAALAGAGSNFFAVFLAVVLAWLSFVSAHALSLVRSSPRPPAPSIS